MKIAIIGAGIGGLTAAALLQEQGHLKRRTKNAKAFHDKCEKLDFPPIDETVKYRLNKLNEGRLT
ncbi:NAD(P)-binding protein, partial [Staphylococcus aureus]